MTFQPVIPVGGLPGWSFLQRTFNNQKAAFENGPRLQNDLTYFEQNIGKVTSAEGLVSDRRLLSVALGAFGLDDDIDNRFFIQKVLSDGTLDETALANRLSDKKYLQLSEAFGFGDFDTPRTQLSDFSDQITSAYKDRQFEIAVGNQDENMRLALTLNRELGTLSESDSSDETKWFSVMGSPPLRKVFETVFGLPTSFGALDLDRQMSTFREKASQVFGESEVQQFRDPEKMEALVQNFLTRADLASAQSINVRGATALTLLQSSQIR